MFDRKPQSHRLPVPRFTYNPFSALIQTQLQLRGIHAVTPDLTRWYEVTGEMNLTPPQSDVEFERHSQFIHIDTSLSVGYRHTQFSVYIDTDYYSSLNGTPAIAVVLSLDHFCTHDTFTWFCVGKFANGLSGDVAAIRMMAVNLTQHTVFMDEDIEDGVGSNTYVWFPRHWARRSYVPVNAGDNVRLAWVLMVKCSEEAPTSSLGHFRVDSLAIYDGSNIPSLKDYHRSIFGSKLT